MNFKDYQQKPMFIVLPDYDELFPKLSVQRVIDNFVNSLDLSDVIATYRDGGAPLYHPSVLLKVILYAYSRNIYGCRPIATLCHTDMVCQWFTNFQSPSFSTINRFRSDHMGEERTVAVFSKLVETLVSDGLVSFEECTYVDGTTMESRASRTKLVWVQAQRRYAEQNRERIEAIVAAARKGQAADAEDCPREGGGEEEPATGGGADGGTGADAGGGQRGKRRDRSVHMSPEQIGRIRDGLASGELGLPESGRRELEQRLDKAERYRRRDDMCGDKSGTASTDPDSVAMHPKDDVTRKGPCLPMYNVQFMTQSQFILWLDLFGVTTDMSAFPLLLGSLPVEFTPSKAAADAGYGSYENYVLARQRGIDPYFKYGMYDKECSPRFKPGPFQAEYFPVQEDGTLRCPGGVLRKTREYTETRSGVPCTRVCYRTDQCPACHLRDKCHGRHPRDFREVKLKREWYIMKAEIRAKLGSGEGRTLLANRGKDVEPAFSHTKWAGAYRRFRHFGIGRCRLDLVLRAIAHNLKKYAVRIQKEADGRIEGSPARPQTAPHSPTAALCGQMRHIVMKIRRFAILLRKHLSLPENRLQQRHVTPATPF